MCCTQSFANISFDSNPNISNFVSCSFLLETLMFCIQLFADAGVVSIEHADFEGGTFWAYSCLVLSLLHSCETLSPPFRCNTSVVDVPIHLSGSHEHAPAVYLNPVSIS
jgi:hypothetical protein